MLLNAGAPADDQKDDDDGVVQPDAQKVKSENFIEKMPEFINFKGSNDQSPDLNQIIF